MWYIYTMEYYTAEKNNDIMKFAGKWMELENVILSKVHHAYGVHGGQKKALDPLDLQLQMLLAAMAPCYDGLYPISPDKLILLTRIYGLCNHTQSTNKSSPTTNYETALCFLTVRQQLTECEHIRLGLILDSPETFISSSIQAVCPTEVWETKNVCSVRKPAKWQLHQVTHTPPPLTRPARLPPARAVVSRALAGARLPRPSGSGAGATLLCARGPGEEHTTVPRSAGGKSRPPCRPPLGDPAGLRRRRTRQSERTAGLDPELRAASAASAAGPTHPGRGHGRDRGAEPGQLLRQEDKKKKKERSSRAANAASGSSSATGARPGDGGSSGSGARSGDGGSSGSGARSGDGGSSGSGARSGDGGSSRPGDGGSTGSGGKAVTKDEDEWKEFEQKEVDYSGLRVQAMQISEKEDDDNEKREDPGDNWEEGGGGSGVEKSSGPWNKTAPVQAPPAPVIGIKKWRRALK
ncbi:hypothetical protein STEG23_003101 [Scotinomys teguina]